MIKGNYKNIIDTILLCYDLKNCFKTRILIFNSKCVFLHLEIIETFWIMSDLFILVCYYFTYCLTFMIMILLALFHVIYPKLISMPFYDPIQKNSHEILVRVSILQYVPDIVLKHHLGF